MKPLSIKLEDKLRDDFDTLCKSEEKTQVAMFASLMECYSNKPAQAPEIEALQGKLAELQAKLQAAEDASADEIDRLRGDNSILKDAAARLEQANADLTADLQACKDSDLSQDVKELGRITVLETAIYEYGKGRVRARLGNPSLLTKDEAVEAFVKTNTPK